MSDTPRTNNYVADFPGSRREPRLLDFARQLETELAEARAEIERLKQLWSCNLDIIGGELNKQLVEARAEIEKQDALLEKCLGLLKQQKERGE